MQEFRSRQSALTAKQRKEWRGNMEGIILEERKRLGALLDTHTQAEVMEKIPSGASIWRRSGSFCRTARPSGPST